MNEYGLNQCQCEILVGTTSYSIKVEGKEVDGKVYYDKSSLMYEQERLAEELLKVDEPEFNVNVFNFVINVAGIKGTTLARFMGMTSASISRARRNKGVLSKTAWKLFRLVMLSYISKKSDEMNKIALRYVA